MYFLNKISKIICCLHFQKLAELRSFQETLKMIFPVKNSGSVFQVRIFLALLSSVVKGDMNLIGFIGFGSNSGARATFLNAR